MQINEGNLKRMLPPKISPRHPVTEGSPAMCECFTEDPRDSLLAHLAGATHKAELQVTYGRCGRQWYIATCCDSNLHGTETHTVFAGTHTAACAPTYIREQALAVALGQAMKYMQREKSGQRQTQARVLLLEDSMICNKLRAWYQRGAWRFETSAGEAISNLSRELAADLHFPLSIYSVAKVDRIEKPVVANPHDAATVPYYS